MKRLDIVIGTRPEIIKMSPLIPKLEKKFNLRIIYTGQHYSEIMSTRIFDDLNIKKPEKYFNSKNTNSAKQFPEMITKVVGALEEDKPSAVIVHGDTNTTLAGALAANKLGIPVVHIESGARSGNKNEPEELNRMLVDQISYINFPFNSDSEKCLKRENININIFNLPNTAREAVQRNILIAKKNSKILNNMKIERGNYIISTLHRATNTNNIKNLKKYLYTINQLSKKNMVVVSMHPRTSKIIKENNLKISNKIVVMQPVGYLDFLLLLDGARFALSDSGGIVDESLVLNIPLVIFRSETERSDVIKMKKAFLLNPNDKNQEIKQFLEKFNTDKNLNKIKTKKVDFKIQSTDQMVKIISKLIK